jgi:putative transposase
MNPPKCNDLDYIQFLIASQHTFTATEAAKTHPDGEEGPAHDAYTRLLYRTQSDGYALWQEVKSLVALQKGMLVLDDSTLDKLYAQQMDLVTYHWSGKHKAVVKGINLLSLLWTDGEARLPCDFRIYSKKQDGLTKNDHFREMLRQAQQRGFEPELVAFDSWYASLKNLKLLRRLQWPWLCRLQKDRQVDPDGQGNRQIQSIHIPGMADKSISRDMAGSKFSGQLAKMATLNTGPPVIERCPLSKRLKMPCVPGKSKSTIAA